MRIIVQARATAHIGCRITPQPDVDPPWVTTRWPHPKLTLMRPSRPYAHCRDVCGSTLRLFAAFRRCGRPDLLERKSAFQGYARDTEVPMCESRDLTCESV